MLKVAAETVLPFKCSDPEGHSYRYFLPEPELLVQDRGQRRGRQAMPSRLPAHRDPTRILEPGHRRSADRIGPSRKGAAALAPLFPMGYHQARSVRSNLSRLQVTGCGLGVVS
jgi:hypothetical protein